MMEFTLTGNGRKMLKIFVSAVIVSVAYAGLVGIAAISFIQQRAAIVASCTTAGC
jgi:hypothetical protein